MKVNTTAEDRAKEIIAAMPGDLKHIRSRHGAPYSYEYTRDEINSFLASKGMPTSQDPIKQRRLLKSYVVGNRKDNFDPATIMLALQGLKASGLLDGSDNQALEEAEQKRKLEQAEAENRRRQTTLFIGLAAAAVALILILK